MDEAAPRKFSILSGFPLRPVGTRGKDAKPRRTNTHKAEVAQRAYEAWQTGKHGVLREVAEVYMNEYYGRTSYGTYYESKRENLMRRLRGMLPKSPDVDDVSI